MESAYIKGLVSSFMLIDRYTSYSFAESFCSPPSHEEDEMTSSLKKDVADVVGSESYQYYVESALVAARCACRTPI